MKKWYASTAIVLGIFMLFAACAPAAPAEPSKTAETQQTPTSTVPEPTPEPTQSPEPMIISEEPSATPVQIDEDIEAMLPVMDSVIRAMKENDSDYAPDDDTFFWTTIYLAAVNFGESLQMAEAKGAYVTVNRQTVQEIASACFEKYSDLPEIPDTVSGAVSYDKKQDAYLFALSDIGDSNTKVVDAEPNGDTTMVSVEFTSWDEAENYEFTLVPNPYADAIAEPVFLYTVRSAERLG